MTTCFLYCIIYESTQKTKYCALAIKGTDRTEAQYNICIRKNAKSMLNNGTSCNLHDLLRVVHGSVQQADLDQPSHDYALFHFQTVASEWFIH